MKHFGMIALELSFGLVLLFLVLKMLGKTQISQMRPFDFISALILGELVGNAVYDHEVRITEILFATILWGTMIFLLEYITLKFKKTRKILEGEPSLVIQQGKLKFDELKKNKVDLNQLLLLLRQQGYFSVQEVEYAILESNGKISVLPKFQYDYPRVRDFQLPLRTVCLPLPLILDGEVDYRNLAKAGLDEEWLKNQLAMQNISDYRDVFYAEWQENEPLFAMRYE
ncbi:DUF421 domain-containing protein [Ammoniphilus sp. YIM 78166]|uniref:DUF421 domain-containing protein n=1 Tax=Ammoniphilus sp. YIM 78166 TaxID=1644106 RepID=UPI0010700F24|nr:DUF421 domain-containing protein [Ammoniphilus sp. YIM 78166]